jgi:hypothetical protein
LTEPRTHFSSSSRQFCPYAPASSGQRLASHPARPFTFHLDAAKKAEQIEKLAHGLKSKIKQTY